MIATAASNRTTTHASRLEPLVSIQQSAAPQPTANQCRCRNIGLCCVCHADAHAMVLSGEITLESLDEMGLRGLGPKLQYLKDLDAELKSEKRGRERTNGTSPALPCQSTDNVSATAGDAKSTLRPDA